MISCNETKELMSLYLDNRLDNSKRREIKRHLASCTLCRTQMDEIAEISRMCVGIPQVSLPENFKAELHKKLVEVQKSEEIKKNSTVLRNKYFKVFGTIAACLVIVVLMRILFGDTFLNLSTRGMMKGEKSVQESAPSDSAMILSEEVADSLESKENNFGIMQAEDYIMEETEDGTESFAPRLESFEESDSGSHEGFTTEGDLDAVSSRLILSFNDSIKSLDYSITKVKEVAVQNGVELFGSEGLWYIEDLVVRQDKANFIISFNLPSRNYTGFIDTLNSIVELKSVNVFPISQEDTIYAVREMNLILNRVNEEISELNKNNVSNSKEIDRLMEKRYFLENEIIKTYDGSGFTLVTIEFKHVK